MDVHTSPFSLDGQRILVTGASSGLGRACARFLASTGARLVISGRNAERLDETLGSLAGEGHIASPYDLGQLDGVSAWVRSLSAGDPLSGLVHCAGIYLALPVKAIDINAFRRVMSTNADSAFALARAFRQKGAYRPPASIALMASIAGMVGNPGLSAYGASKAAIIGMTKSLAMEFVHDGIRVNSVSPGYVHTEMTRGQEAFLSAEQIKAIEDSHPLGIGNPEDVAAAVSYLLSPAAKWITGSNLVVDGGASAL